MNKSKTPETGVKKIVVLLGLLILSPLVMSFGIKALRIYTEAPKVYIAYTLITLGCILVLYTVFFGIKTFKTILDILFNS